MVIPMETLKRKFRPFREIGSSNLEASSNEKFKDKDPEKIVGREPKKERPSFSITSFQSLFKAEVKVDIKPYQGEIDVVK
jgi:hypothetical protein